MQALTDLLARCTDVDQLAQGGQKTVYCAIHPEFGHVVVKYGEYRSATRLDRITREVQLLKELNSPYYPRQYEFLVDPTDREFIIVEERLDASELRVVFSRFADDSSILKLLRDLVRGLSVIWSRNVIHRDLKPENILIAADNTPRIIDLGIARFLDKTSLTLSVAPHGPATLIYAAPEQLMNRKPMIGVRTDFFLLGIVSLELMLGYHPFDPRYVGNQSSTVENILSGTFVTPSGHDPILEGFVTRALRIEPYRRFRTQAEVAEYLAIEI